MRVLRRANFAAQRKQAIEVWPVVLRIRLAIEIIGAIGISCLQKVISCLRDIVFVLQLQQINMKIMGNTANLQELAHNKQRYCIFISHN